MNKKRKIAIIAVSVILGIIMLLVAAGAGVYQFYVKPKFAEIIQTEEGDAFDANKILEDVETTLEEEDVKTYINDENPEETEELKSTIQDAKVRNEQQKSESTSVGGYKSKYEQAKEEIAPADLKDGMALAAKVDAGYILGLLSGGLTAEEKHELKMYLTARLSPSEISRGIQLFAKYSYLL